MLEIEGISAGGLKGSFIWMSLVGGMSLSLNLGALRALSTAPDFLKVSMEIGVERVNLLVLLVLFEEVFCLDILFEVSGGSGGGPRRVFDGAIY